LVSQVYVSHKGKIFKTGNKEANILKILPKDGMIHKIVYLIKVNNNGEAEDPIVVFDFQEAIHQQSLAWINEGFREFQLWIKIEDES
jgi:hypothetical protein